MDPRCLLGVNSIFVAIQQQTLSPIFPTRSIALGSPSFKQSHTFFCMIEDSLVD
jgi:hypothetical protein